MQVDQLQAAPHASACAQHFCNLSVFELQFSDVCRHTAGNADADVRGILCERIPRPQVLQGGTVQALDASCSGSRLPPGALHARREKTADFQVAGKAASPRSQNAMLTWPSSSDHLAIDVQDVQVGVLEVQLVPLVAVALSSTIPTSFFTLVACFLAQRSLRILLEAAMLICSCGLDAECRVCSFVCTREQKLRIAETPLRVVLQCTQGTKFPA